jgi:hypothetical protein
MVFFFSFFSFFAIFYSNLDVNECSNTPGICATLDTKAICKNTIGSYYCNCSSGYTTNDIPATPCTGIIPSYIYFTFFYKFNTDVNECSDSPGICAIIDTKATCTNTFGSFYCNCSNGYTTNNTMATPCYGIFLFLFSFFCYFFIQILDVNECSNTPGICATLDTKATCKNTIGSYSCNCSSGYTMDNTMATPCYGIFLFLFFFFLLPFFYSNFIRC